MNAFPKVKQHDHGKTIVQKRSEDECVNERVRVEQGRNSAARAP